MGIFDKHYVFMVSGCDGGESSFIVHLRERGIRVSKSGVVNNKYYFSVKGDDEVNRLVTLLRQKPEERGFKGRVEAINDVSKINILQQMQYSY